MILGGAQRAAAFVVANLVTVVGAVVLLRYLGVEDFGRYGTVLALIGVVQGISDAGLTATGTRELALCRTDAERRDVLAHIVGLRVVLTAAGVARRSPSRRSPDTTATSFSARFLAGIGVFLTSVQTAMLLPLGVELRNGVLALVEMARQLVLVSGVRRACRGRRRPRAVLRGPDPGGRRAARDHARAALLDRARRAALDSRPHPGARDHRAAGGHGHRARRPLSEAARRADVGVSANEDEIGYFVTSTRVFEVVGGLPFLIGAVVLPVLTAVARDDQDRLVYMTGRITQMMAFGGVLVALVLWTLAEPLVVLLGGEEYEPAAPVLQIQCFAAITMFVDRGWQPTLVRDGPSALVGRRDGRRRARGPDRGPRS